MDSIFWARKLTLEKTNKLIQNPSIRKCWMTNQVFDIINEWGIGFAGDIFTFSLDEYSETPINHMVMSYVKIERNKNICILVNAISNFCWQRFYIAKELIHVVSSNSENATVGSSRIIEVLTNLHDMNFSVYLQDKAFTAELDASLGAMEFLLPKELVEKEEALVNGYKNLSDDHLSQIAHKYRVPKVIVKSRFTEESVRKVFDNSYKSNLYQDPQFLPIYKR